MRFYCETLTKSKNDNGPSKSKKSSFFQKQEKKKDLFLLKKNHAIQAIFKENIVRLNSATETDIILVKYCKNGYLFFAAVISKRYFFIF